jgi:hypothetical protein
VVEILDMTKVDVQLEIKPSKLDEQYVKNHVKLDQCMNMLIKT